MGDFIQAMAQSWLVWTLTGSPFLLGVVGFAKRCRACFGRRRGAIVDASSAPAAALDANFSHGAAFIFGRSSIS